MAVLCFMGKWGSAVQEICIAYVFLAWGNIMKKILENKKFCSLCLRDLPEGYPVMICSKCLELCKQCFCSCCKIFHTKAAPTYYSPRYKTCILCRLQEQQQWNGFVFAVAFMQMKCLCILIARGFVVAGFVQSVACFMKKSRIVFLGRFIIAKTVWMKIMKMIRRSLQYCCNYLKINIKVNL